MKKKIKFDVVFKNGVVIPDVDIEKIRVKIIRKDRRKEFDIFLMEDKILKKIYSSIREVMKDVG